MWFLFQIAIMTLIIGSNGAYHWAPKGGGFAVALLAALAASWLSVWLNDLFEGCVASASPSDISAVWAGWSLLRSGLTWRGSKRKRQSLLSQKCPLASLFQMARCGVAHWSVLDNWPVDI